MTKALIAIVGRPNVGKSTLFNRLVGHRAAVVTNVPGTTRDRISLDTFWEGRPIVIVDTGGLGVGPESALAQQVHAQVEMAIEAADTIILVTDVRDGPTPVDADISDRLRQTGKPVTLAVNKADTPALARDVMDFYRLGLGEPLPISSHHNLGIGQLMTLTLGTIPEHIEPEEATDVLSLAIIGRTNVGKSAFLNAILGEERTIVSESPGTTRDAIDTPILYHEQKLLLIDTAGIRRRGKIEPGIERYSVLRSVLAIDRANVVLLVLDTTDLATAQDTHIAGQIADAYKGVVIVVNKWDLAPQLDLDQADCLPEIRSRFKFMPYAPIRFASALEQTGVTDVLDTALMVSKESRKTVPHRALSSAVMTAMANHPPPARGRSSLRLYRVAQEGVEPPTFVFYVNDAKLIHFSYQRYLENRLRHSLGFRWSPMKLTFRGRK